jgi:hypothetical protein
MSLEIRIDLREQAPNDQVDRRGDYEQRRKPRARDRVATIRAPVERIIRLGPDNCPPEEDQNKN